MFFKLKSNHRHSHKNKDDQTKRKYIDAWFWKAFLSFEDAVVLFYSLLPEHCD